MAFLTRNLLPEDLERFHQGTNIRPEEAPFVDEFGYSAFPTLGSRYNQAEAVLRTPGGSLEQYVYAGNVRQKALDTARDIYNSQMIPDGKFVVDNRTYTSYSQVSSAGGTISPTSSLRPVDSWTHELTKYRPSDQALTIGQEQYLRAQREYASPTSAFPFTADEIPSMLGTGHISNYVADYYTNPQRASIGGGPDANRIRAPYPAGDPEHSNVDANRSFVSAASSIPGNSTVTGLSVGLMGSKIHPDWAPYLNVQWAGNDRSSGTILQSTVGFNTPFGIKRTHGRQDPSYKGVSGLTNWESSILKNLYW